MGSIPARECQLARVLTTVVIVLTLSMTVHLSDVTTGAIEYDDMTINWRIETIDDGPHIVPGKASIAVDPSGGVHVSYHDGMVDGLRYAYKPPDGEWTSQVIDSPGVGNHSEIGVDSKGVVHIAFENLVNGALKHAVKRPGEDWDIRVVDPGPGTGGFPTLDIDAGDRLFIAYRDWTNMSLKIAISDEQGAWNITNVDIVKHRYYGGHDLAISGNGTMYLVYSGGSWLPNLLGGYFAYRWPGEDWRMDLDPSIGGDESNCSIACDKDGLPYVSSFGGRTLKYRVPSGHWYSYSYFEDQGLSSYGDIRFDSRGYWLVCGHTTQEDLRYIQSTPVNKFRTGIVDGRTGTGAHASMAVGPDGRFHIVYYNEADGRLEYATDANRPSEPIGLTATPGERNIMLEWGVPARLGNATSVTFNIYRNETKGFSYVLYRKGLEGTSFLDTQVENWAFHRYIVVAVNGAGEGDFSDIAWAYPQLHPTRPQNVTATAGPDNVVLRWEPPGDPGAYTVTGYRIYWRTGTYWSGFGPEYQYPESEWSEVTVDGPATNFNHTSLLRGYTYHYEIAAVHASGEGERSGDVSAIPMVPPGAPTALAAVREDGWLFLNWTRPTDDGGCRLTAYRVYRGTSPVDLRLVTTINGSGGDWNMWDEPSRRLFDNGTAPEYVGWGVHEGREYVSPKFSYGLPGTLGDNVTYYYQVSAVQLAGEGSRSPVLEVPPEMTPRAPRNLTAIAVGEGVKLSWMPPARDYYFVPSGYVIYRIGPDGELTVVERVREETFKYLDKGVVSNSTYRYCVRGVNEAGEGNSSEWAEVPVGVVTPAHEPFGDGWHWPLTYLALSIALACIVLAVLVMRRRADRKARGD